jgi:hypothetical protein
MLGAELNEQPAYVDGYCTCFLIISNLLHVLLV